MARAKPEPARTGCRGPLLAALLALFAALPAALGLPLIDRQEARTVQATAQMLESGDFVAISFQDRIRAGQPIGVHWLQAASVSLTSKVEARQVLPYRAPSILAAMLLAAATAWGAGALLGRGAATAAGLITAASFGPALTGGLAASQAASAAGLTLALAALAHIHAAAHAGSRQRPGPRILFWAGLLLAILCGGWAPVLTAILAGLLLFTFDRSAPWARRLGWGWGLIVLASVIGPWIVAITVTTDGGYWGSAAAEQAPWSPPGAPTLAALLLFFPFSGLAIGAIATAWAQRASAAVRFAAAWLAAAWLIAELTPGRSALDVLPMIPPLAWLVASAAGAVPPRWARRTGIALSILPAAAFAGLALWLAARHGHAGIALFAAVLFLAAGVLVGLRVSRPALDRRLLIAGAVGLAAQGMLIGGLLPSLDALWPSQRTVRALAREGLHPREGLVQGPVTVAGYVEPSLVFGLGARTEVGAAAQAAQAIAEGRPAIVEAREETAFRAALARGRVRAQRVASIDGLDYATGEDVRLDVWRRIR